MASTWQVMMLEDAILINPQRVLPKGVNAPFVAMEDIVPCQRDIEVKQEREYRGSGSRFTNGDTLFARITPCLENGKTALISELPQDIVGHGSTEFIVMSGKEGLSDSLFVYYLARDPNFRSYAIQRMEGTSGRQRVPVSALSNLIIELPSLPEQRAIAHILGTLDDKIELNRQMNQTLEAMAQALFKSWFVDFEPFRDQGIQDSPLGEIPMGWRVQKVGQVLELKYGKGLREGDRTGGNVPVYGSNGQVGWHNESLVRGPGIVVGRKGNPGTVTWAPIDFFPIDTTFYVEPTEPIRSMAYLFHALQLLGLPSLGADSAVPGLNRNMAYMSDILVPPPATISSFDRYTEPLMRRVYINDRESQTLSDIRDALLPKLLSREIRVKDAEKFMESKV